MRIFLFFVLFLLFMANIKASSCFYVGLNPSYTQSKFKANSSTSFTVDKVGPINNNTDDQFIRSDLIKQSPSKNKVGFEFFVGFRSNLNPLLIDVDISTQMGNKKVFLGSLENIFSAAIAPPVAPGDDPLPIGADEENVSVYLKTGASYGFSLRGGVEIFDQTNLFLGITAAVQLGRVYTQGSFVDDDAFNTYSVNKSASYTSISFTPEIMVERALDDQITGTFTLGYRNAVRRSISGNISGLTLGDRGFVAKVGLRYYF